MSNKIICDLAPTAENNRNSEGAFITLKNGGILFAYSRYGNAGDDDGAAADIYGMISEDNGESFSKPFPIITHTQMNADNVMSVSFLRMKNGDIGMFYLAKTDIIRCLCYLIRSADEGKTWSSPVLCSENDGYFVVNNDRVIRLNNDRLLIPASFHKMHIIDGKLRGEPGRLYFFASDDDGHTWNTLAKDIPLPISRGCKKGVQEPGALQLDDSRVWCYIRNDTGRQYETFSNDNGITWSTPLPSQFTSAVSPLCTKKLSDDRIVAVWNPIPLYNGRDERPNGVWTGGRTPLAIAVSSDGGENFGTLKLIETDENSGYCYTAIFETCDNSLLLAYCAGGTADGSTLNRLRIRKISIEEI